MQFFHQGVEHEADLQTCAVISQAMELVQSIYKRFSDRREDVNLQFVHGVVETGPVRTWLHIVKKTLGLRST